MVLDLVNSGILIGGSVTTRDGIETAAIVRLHADGTLDSSFGSSGVFVTPRVDDHESWLNDIALQSDGSIVGAGGMNGPANSGVHQFMLVRIRPSGQLDTTFGDGGLSVGQPQGVGHAEALSIDPDDRIVVAGQIAPDTAWLETAFTTVRYLADGSLDSTFGMNGVAMPAFENGRDLAWNIAMQPDGRPVVVGQALGTEPQAQSDAAVARYNTDGTLDTGFGLQGTTTVPFRVARGVTVDNAGRIVITGIGAYDAILARLLADGSPDTAFGNGGMHAYSTPTGEEVVVSPSDGRILGVRWIVSGFQSSHMSLARYDGAGAVDPSFGTNGVALASTPSPANQGQDLAVQVDGRIVVVGTRMEFDGRMDIFAARFCH